MWQRASSGSGGSGGIKETLTIVNGQIATAYKTDGSTLTVTNYYPTNIPTMNSFSDYVSVSYVQGTGWTFTAKKSGRFQIHFSPTGADIDVTKSANEVIVTFSQGFNTNQYGTVAVY